MRLLPNGRTDFEMGVTNHLLTGINNGRTYLPLGVGWRLSRVGRDVLNKCDAECSTNDVHG